MVAKFKLLNSNPVKHVWTEQVILRGFKTYKDQAGPIPAAAHKTVLVGEKGRLLVLTFGRERERIYIYIYIYTYIHAYIYIHVYVFMCSCSCSWRGTKKPKKPKILESWRRRGLKSPKSLFFFFCTPPGKCKRLVENVAIS